MLKLDDYIDRVQHLPPAPRLLPELLELLRRSDIDSSRVVSLITYDPSLTAHVLQLCNTAFFAASSPVVELEEAVVRLGFEQIYRLVAALCGSRTIATRHKRGGTRDADLWRHSVTAAVAAQLIARDLDQDQNLVFTAALLHDLGKVILSEALESKYEQLLAEVEEHQQSLLETEKLLLGVQHAELGGRLLERWEFPTALVSAVRCHHEPLTAASEPKVAAVVYLGNMIAYFMGHGDGQQAFSLRGRADALDVLKLNGDQLPGYMCQTYEDFAAVQAFFSLVP